MNDLYLRACRRQPVERPPIWIMRQAGRYLPEYRKVREELDFLSLCKTPDRAAEVSIQPIDRLGVDACILFSDILIPAEPMGCRFEFNPGPVLDRPVRSAGAVDRLTVPDFGSEVPYVYETIRLLRRELDGRVPLIGFGAAPFTLAVYLVEGGGSKNFDWIKRMLFAVPETAHLLLDKISDALAGYLAAQATAGAQAIQLFDTWAGILAPAEYREFALRHVRSVIERLRPTGVPLIYFALNSGHLLEEIRECGADVVGLDWRTDLAQGSRRLEDRFTVQGNLDPCVLLSTPEIVQQRAKQVLASGAAAPAHIFNLGHGILPSTPVENAQALVETVKGFAG